MALARHPSRFICERDAYAISGRCNETPGQGDRAWTDPRTRRRFGQSRRTLGQVSVTSETYRCPDVRETEAGSLKCMRVPEAWAADLKGPFAIRSRS